MEDNFKSKRLSLSIIKDEIDCNFDDVWMFLGNVSWRHIFYAWTFPRMSPKVGRLHRAWIRTGRDVTSVTASKKERFVGYTVTLNGSKMWEERKEEPFQCHQETKEGIDTGITNYWLRKEEDIPLKFHDLCHVLYFSSWKSCLGTSYVYYRFRK